MERKIKCDIVILGGGAGGLSLAATAASLGAHVVLVESDKMGGDCLNYGCVPSKSLLSAAKAFYHVKTAAYFGAHVSALSLDFSKVMQHLHQVIATIEKKDSIERYTSLGVTVIQARGEFVDKKTVKAGDTVIQAKRCVIATGSSPFIPAIPGLDKVSYETNETIFNLKELPKHVIVIGGGPIGCELAQAFALLGSQVTLLEGFKILPKDDSDCVEIIRQQFEALGIRIYENCAIQNIHSSVSGESMVTIEHEAKTYTLTGTHLLISTGRRANVHGLALEKAGVAYSPKGIIVDAHLRSSNKNVYAIGDVAGSFQFTHIANYQAMVVLKNILFRLPTKVDYRAIPWVTYTLPELAHVGLTIEEAKKRSDIQMIEWPYQDNDRAQAEHETAGKIKIITNKKANILGVTIVGAQAGELILPWIMAIQERKTLRSFTDVVVPYPTLSEISKRVAGEFYIPKLLSGKMRWLVKLLLKLG